LPFAQIEDLCAQIAGRLDTLTFAHRQAVVRTLLRRVSTGGDSVALDGAFEVLSMSLALREGDAPLALGEPDGAGADGAAGAIATTRL
jgi:hypothetical protein